jgi:DNA-directed RNA polymerase subunit RPC12/RpoP
MGVFDTYTIPCPHCNSLVEDQRKPGSMDYFTFGEDPRKDLDFAGFYSCNTCHKNFTVELETLPKMIVKKEEE